MGADEQFPWLRQKPSSQFSHLCDDVVPHTDTVFHYGWLTQMFKPDILNGAPSAWCQLNNLSVQCRHTWLHSQRILYTSSVLVPGCPWLIKGNQRFSSAGGQLTWCSARTAPCQRGWRLTQCKVGKWLNLACRTVSQNIELFITTTVRTSHLQTKLHLAEWENSFQQSRKEYTCVEGRHLFILESGLLYCCEWTCNVQKVQKFFRWIYSNVDLSVINHCLCVISSIANLQASALFTRTVFASISGDILLMKDYVDTWQPW